MNPHIRRFAIILIMPVLAGCAALSLETHEEGFNHVLSIHTASLRGTNAEGEHTAERAPAMSYLRTDVEVPHRHRPGQIVEPGTVGAAPDMAFEKLDETGIGSLNAFSRDVLASAPGNRVVLFVHGFNNDYDHSLYRLAQMAHDFELPAAPVLFAWPADDSLISYIHDRDSIDYSRRALALLLENLVSHGARVQLIAHSMGAALVMETLADFNLRGSSLPHRLDGVTFISPDMDLDLFLQRANELNHLPSPFTIYTVPGQVAFRFMTALFTDGEPRLGGEFDTDRLSGLDLTFVDITDVSHGSILDVHFGLATSPEIIEAVTAMSRPDFARFPDFIRNAPGVEVESIGRMTWMRLPEPLLLSD